MKYTQYIGILLGAVYGLGLRIFFGQNYFDGIYKNYSIYSITFIWIVPIIIGLIPILFAREEILKSKWKQVTFPILSVLLFFLFALSMGLEDWLCIIILVTPFLFSAGILGLFSGEIIKKLKSKKLLSILFLPFILSPLESSLPGQKTNFNVSTAIIIDAPQDKVWKNLLEVPEITEQEYEEGFFNYLGIPRPIKSKLEIIDGTQYRIGYFSERLKLYETISELDSLHFINLKIRMDKSELRDLPTDKHLLQSNNFKFENISYKVVRIDREKTKLILSCNYLIDSKINGYANFWAERIIKDFEVRLLKVLKNKAEAQHSKLQ